MQFMEQINLSEKPYILLSVGELNVNKNHRVVINALGKLKKDHIGQYENIHYCIAGIGSLDKELLHLAMKNEVEKQVHLLGYQNDIPRLMRLADVFIHPSFREGLPVSVMEAMACGLPIIAANIRGLQDLVSDGKGGRLVFSYDFKEYAKMIQNAYEYQKEWKQMGDYNIRKVQKFSLTNVNKHMQNLYIEF